MSPYLQVTRPEVWRNASGGLTFDAIPVSPGINIDAIIDMYMYPDSKPRTSPSNLSPRAVSSIYSISEEYAPVSPGKFLSSISLSQGHSRTCSSTSKVLQRLSLRSNKDQGASSGTKKKASERGGEQKVGQPQEPQEIIHPGRLVSWGIDVPEPRIREIDFFPADESGFLAPRPFTLAKAPKREDRHTYEQRYDAARWAEDYQSAFQPVSPLSPSSGPFHALSTNFPSLMSPRITDVSNDVVIPEIMSISSTDLGGSPGPLSHNSWNLGGLALATRKSLRTDPRSPLQSPKSTQLGVENISLNRNGSYSDSRKHKKNSSIGKHHSFQHGMSNMYDTLQSMYSTIPRTRVDADSVKLHKRQPRERSPAIPLTDYQKYGTQAWERPQSPLTRSKSAKQSSKVTLPSNTMALVKGRAKTRPPPNAGKGLTAEERKRMMLYSMDQDPGKELSVGKKLANAFQSGTENMVGLDRHRSRRVRDEERRKELKKMIKVLVPRRNELDGEFF